MGLSCAETCFGARAEPHAFVLHQEEKSKKAPPSEGQAAGSCGYPDLELPLRAPRVSTLDAQSYRLPPRDFQLLSRRAAAALDSEAWLETAPLSLAALLEAPRFPQQARGALQPRHLPLALLCLCRLVANCLGMKGAI